jgi:hypothetical protein
LPNLQIPFVFSYFVAIWTIAVVMFSKEKTGAAIIPQLLVGYTFI